MDGPLAGIKIIDASEVISGPLAAMLLADQGADVIKVEPPNHGEEVRQLVNYRDGMNAMYANVNHNKRSVGINLKDPVGLEVLYDLVRDADVFVQNWRPGAAERLRVGEDDLRRVNPDIIYASVTGYGDDGPYADRRGYDPIFQALTGYVGAQFNPEVPFPDLVRNAVVDKATSYTLAQGITAALLARERGGPPQHVKVAMVDAGLAFFWPDGMLRHTFIGEQPESFVVPGERYQLTPTADGQIVMFMGTSQQMRDGLRAVGRADLADAPQHQGKESLKQENQEERAVAMRGAIAKMTTEQVYQALIEAEIPVAPALSLEGVLVDPQIQHNGSIIAAEHPVYGAYRRVAPAARFSAMPFTAGLHPAFYGEHTAEVLTEHGYDDEQIDGLREADVIPRRPPA